MINLIKNKPLSNSYEGLQPSSQAIEESNIPTRRTCGTMDLHRKLLDQSEEYRRERTKIDREKNK